MILARIGICAAICCTLYFNGSYAFAKSGGHGHQYAMVAMMVTIDLCKATFLPAALYVYMQGRYLGALILALLFVPCFSFSTFAGYSYLRSQQFLSTSTDAATAATRKRAQRDYDQATADLAIAKTHRYWKQSGGCTSPRKSRQRTFCKNVAATRQTQTTASTTLAQSKVVAVNPEIQTLATLIDVKMTTLEFAVAGIPALILELVSGLGLFAIAAKGQHRVPDKPSQRLFRSWLPRIGDTTENASEPAPSSTQATSQPVATSQLAAPAKLIWPQASNATTR